MPKAPECAPPPLTLLRQAVDDLPELKALQQKIELKVNVWERNLEAARAELMEINARVARKQAHIDAALATIRAQDQGASATRPSRPVSPERPRPSKARRLE